MNFPVVFEKINDKDFPNGYYYAHIPTLGLTTHGKGLAGAKKAALDLTKLWIDEKRSNNEEIVITDEFLFSAIEVV